MALGLTCPLLLHALSAHPMALNSIVVWFVSAKVQLSLHVKVTNMVAMHKVPKDKRNKIQWNNEYGLATYM